MSPRPQARTRLLHAAHVALEAALEDARDALDGRHDGLTEAFDVFVSRVAKVSRAIAGPPPRVRSPNKAAQRARATSPAAGQGRAGEGSQGMSR